MEHGSHGLMQKIKIEVENNQHPNLGKVRYPEENRSEFKRYGVDSAVGKQPETTVALRTELPCFMREAHPRYPPQ